MPSPVQIANQALSTIGTRSSILSFTEVSPEAYSVNLWYDNVRQTLLRMAQWGFARAYINLALVKSAPGTATNPNPTLDPSLSWDPRFPPPPWLFEYAYPAGCLMARYVVAASTQQVSGVPIFSTNNPVPWQTLGPPIKSIMITDQDENGADFKAICTNQPSATLCYTRDVLDPNVWDSAFSSAMIAGLASAMAIALTGDKNLAKLLAGQANDTVMAARVMSANEGLPTQEIIPDWIRIRGSTYGWDSTGYTQMLESFGPLFSTPS